MIARLVFPKWNLIASHARNSFTVSSNYMCAIADAPRNAPASVIALLAGSRSLYFADFVIVIYIYIYIYVYIYI
jgi:hypothetical protein